MVIIIDSPWAKMLFWPQSIYSYKIFFFHAGSRPGLHGDAYEILNF